MSTGPWDPTRAAALMSDFPAPWYIAGGWALDLYLGRLRRPHKDLDIAIWREDQAALRKHLHGWEPLKYVGREGLVPWREGEWLDLPVTQVILQVGSNGHAELEALLAERTDGEWWWYRNREIRRSVDLVSRRSEEGVPFLSPEVVLLFKSRHVYHLYRDNPNYVELVENDEADFRDVRPSLNEEQRGWLKRAIEVSYPGHQWLEQL